MCYYYKMIQGLVEWELPDETYKIQIIQESQRLEGILKKQSRRLSVYSVVATTSYKDQ